MRASLFALILCAIIPGGRASALDDQTVKLTRAPIGTPIVVTPGQEFYAQVEAEPTPAYHLQAPFKSTMPGTMGLPFGFAVDADTLVFVYESPSGWDYFIPPNHQYRAWHSLLGSVLRDGDTVGLRVGPAGQKEWFVDNSRYARQPKLWTRPIAPTDPALKPTEVDFITEQAVERLIYLGLSGRDRAKIRFAKVTARKTRNVDFTFPLDAEGRGVGAVNGAEFTIKAARTEAVITVIKAMTSDVGRPLPAPPTQNVGAAPAI